MDLKSLATQLITEKLGGKNDPATTESAIGDLIGGGDKFDLGAIVGKFTGSGGDIAKKAKSWLGDSDNDSISASQLQDVLGSDKIEGFAKKLGIGKEEASDKLSEILPQLIDKGSRGGDLLDSVGGLAGMASKFLK
jgi:uncharacterized protein YidB (DUF937 family)